MPVSLAPVLHLPAALGDLLIRLGYPANSCRIGTDESSLGG
jgi:hypothetical protein